MNQSGWIVRIVTGRTKGWQARVPFGKVNPDTRARRFRSKLFSDLLHGGSKKAREQAERWLRNPTAKGKSKAAPKTKTKAKSKKR